MRSSPYLRILPLLFLLTGTALAYTVPQKIPVQGRLTNASTGIVLSGEYNFTFRIYNASTSGTLLWDENQTLTVDGNGLWDTLLGNNTTLSLNFSEDTYLEVELNHDGNPLPRVQLGSTPYAEWTDTAANLSCTDCLGTDEIEDIYLLNTGDNATGDYMFNGTFKIENSTGSPLLYVNSSDGNVGVGTMAPNGKLDIRSYTNPSIFLSATNVHSTESVSTIYAGYPGSGGWGNVYYRIAMNDGEGGYSDRFTIRGNGNVGIGTTSPSYKLDVAGDIGLNNNSLYVGNALGTTLKPISDSDYSGSQAYTGFAIVSESGTNRQAVTFTDGASSDIIFDVQSSTDSGSTWLDRFVVTQTGNVGIGTTTPVAKLDINGTVALHNNKIYTISGGNDDWYIYLNDTTWNTIVRGYRTTHNRAFQVQDHFGNVSLHAQYGGDIGIGTTSPLAKLDVYSNNSDTEGTVRIQQAGEGDSMLRFRLPGVISWAAGIDNSDSDKFKIGLTTLGSDDKLTIQSNGNVGIGTTSPNGPLEVRGAVDSRVIIAGTNIGATNTDSPKLSFYGSGGSTGIIGPSIQKISTGTWGSGRLAFFQHPAGDYETENEVMSILSNGNVGIGTASPQKLLHLNATGSEIIRIDRTSDANVDSIFSIGVSYTAQNDDYLYLGRTSTVDIVLTDDGNVGIQTTSPDHDLEIGSGTYSEIDAGEAQFTTGSSRTYKENINLVKVEDILGKIKDIPVNTYDFRTEYCNGTDDKCKDKMGLIAEDFHTIFGRGSDKELSGQEVQMALWLAVQELKEENDLKDEKIEALKALVCLDHPDAGVCVSGS